MKKKLTYREKLLELAKIYNVKEVQDYIGRRKNLTSGQIELILRKNKIVIPKDFNTNFFKENFTKPFTKVSRQIDDLKENTSKSANKFSRKISYFKEDSSRSVYRFFINLWRFLGRAGINFLEVIPKLGSTVYGFISQVLTDLFHGIYDQQINKNKVNRTIISFFIIVGVSAAIISGVSQFNKLEKIDKNSIVKETPQKKNLDKKKEQPQTKKAETKNLDQKVKKEVKKPNKELKKKDKVSEIILPDLNLKTETVLNLFEDVNYDLKKVRNEKTVKPIYFTQFPKDLDEIQNVQLKKETFIKIVLPLVVAENAKILDDRLKLANILSRKSTTDSEKQWLRQKFLEYKVKGGNVDELKTRMDIIPVSIALAQAAKESGWGTSRFALEGNAIFGQWTWNGKGIEPLMRDKKKNHKILKFPILRASVKAYKNNLNTHKSYKEFREKRKELRDKNKRISGLSLTKTLENYAQTGSEYTKILAQIIKQNRLMDFEPVKLANSIQKQQFDL